MLADTRNVISGRIDTTNVDMNCKKNDCFTCPYPDCINDYVKKQYKRSPEGVRKIAAYNKKRSEQWETDGLCKSCGKRTPRQGYKMCAECQAKNRRYVERYHRKNGTRLPKVLLDGISRCKRCGKYPPVEGYKLCERCLESARRALDSAPTHNGKTVDNNFTRALRADAERMKTKSGKS